MTKVLTEAQARAVVQAAVTLLNAGSLTMSVTLETHDGHWVGVEVSDGLTGMRTGMRSEVRVYLDGACVENYEGVNGFAKAYLREGDQP